MDLEKFRDVEVAGEEVRFEEIVGGFFACVQVDGCCQGSDEICAGLFECDAHVRYGLGIL